MSRDTATGSVLEQMVLPALRLGGYSYALQVDVGPRLGHGRHIVDAVAEKGSDRFLISVKWQQTGGTAEQKVPFEVMCLAETMRAGGYARAYLVLGGEGWKLRQFYTSGGLANHLTAAALVDIVTLESFIARANQGTLSRTLWNP
ncbi:MAG TPA: PD-(D/E)XK nuclease superfamily protein [Vicinamibacterales bacterium]|nr:PD-(D/E)XK nuclease superfamily protein [Vicinamibacterales bacterium]